MADLTAPQFTSEAAAREHLERVRWPNGAVCPHCGAMDETWGKKAVGRLEGKTTRAGLWKCYVCVGHFTVTVGTVFERSKIPLHKWLLAAHLMCSSKKGISAHQLHRMLGLSYKSAWFMCHRLREAMRDGKLPGPLGGKNKVVEADETFVGGKAKNRKHVIPPKEAVMALVERDGKVRSFHVADVTAKTVGEVLRRHVDADTYLMTDEGNIYLSIGEEFAGHGSVNHSIQEYVRGGFWHTNTIESFFSLFKRGLHGAYHHVSEQHLKRYACEFDFRFNHRTISDAERTTEALKGIEGKRLTYRRANGLAEAKV